MRSVWSNVNKIKEEEKDEDEDEEVEESTSPAGEVDKASPGLM